MKVDELAAARSAEERAEIMGSSLINHVSCLGFESELELSALASRGRNPLHIAKAMFTASLNLSMSEIGNSCCIPISSSSARIPNG